MPQSCCAIVAGAIGVSLILNSEVFLPGSVMTHLPTL